ncbi:ABC transporter permease [Streptococcus intermedius]|uniref:ABC transporter permease n=1 Tax=Streptococcus intermedius TaxID=1338 RepID=UPI00124C87B9|nr:ABC transporter permease [Streptococcus intermedius]
MIRRAFKAELKKYLIEVRTYYPDHLVSMLITYVMFAFFFILNKENSDMGYYIGFLYWYLLSSVIGEASISISAEKQRGSLEQLLLKPIRFEFLIAIKTIIWLLINLIKVLIVFVCLRLTISFKIYFNFSLILIFLLTLIGVFGITLLLVGLTLKYTKTASFESILSYTLLFLTGAAIPYPQMPSWARYLGEFIPIGRGIRISQMVFQFHRLPYGELLLLFVESIIWLLIGYLLFYRIYQSSRSDGLNRNY